MRCREVESLLCDYLDEALPVERRRALEDHIVGCSHCAAAQAEADFAVAILRQTPPVEPPPELVASIIHETIGYGAGAPVPADGRASGVWGFLRPLLHPFLQPRFVMSMAMTALSFSMLTFYGQRAFQQWQGSGDAPAISAVEAFGEDLVGMWQRAGEMLDAARDFYELQTGGALEQEAPASEPAERGEQ